MIPFKEISKYLLQNVCALETSKVLKIKDMVLVMKGLQIQENDCPEPHPMAQNKEQAGQSQLNY